MKALFIPLKAAFYDAFLRGEKTEEYRLRGPRWNAETCQIGRAVVLSRGYGKWHRLGGVITGFHYHTIPERLPGWVECYGKDAGDAAVIRIALAPQKPIRFFREAPDCDGSWLLWEDGSHGLSPVARLWVEGGCVAYDRTAEEGTVQFYYEGTRVAEIPGVWARDTGVLLTRARLRDFIHPDEEGRA